MKTFLVKIIFIIIILSTSVFAEKKICRNCDKEITRAFVTAKGYYFHPSHFECDYCGKEIENSQYYFENNKFYDAVCYDKAYAFPCAYCAENITGKYIEYDNKKYHNRCFKNNVALKCDLCGQVIEGKYFQDLNGRNFHSSHQNDQAQCDYCQTVFGVNNVSGFNYPDGRHICSDCLDIAVDDLDKLKEIANEVNDRLNQYDLDIPLDEIALKLVDKNSLMELYRKKNSHNLMGFTLFEKSTSFFGLSESRDLVIYILEGMPYMWAVSTVAHELNHAQQFLDSDYEKSPPFTEGSANYASYLVLQQYTDNLFARRLIDQILNDDDLIYGEGFRRVKYLVDHNSLEYWRDHLAHNTNFPQGY